MSTPLDMWTSAESANFHTTRRGSSKKSRLAAKFGQAHVCTQTARNPALVIIVRAPAKKTEHHARLQILLLEIAQGKPDARSGTRIRAADANTAAQHRLQSCGGGSRRPRRRNALRPSVAALPGVVRRHNCPGHAGEGMMMRETQPAASPCPGASARCTRNSRRTLLPPGCSLLLLGTAGKNRFQAKKMLLRSSAGAGRTWSHWKA